MLNEINEARSNPQIYAEKIKEYTKNIYKDSSDNNFFSVDLNSKINLPRGKEAFENCIEILKVLNPMPKLILRDKLKLPFPEKYPETAINKDYITSALLGRAEALKDEKNEYTINWFHYDVNIYNPEVSIVLQLVDDTNSNGERRKHLLDEKIKYVGINIGKIRREIYCIYLLFAS